MSRQISLAAAIGTLAMASISGSSARAGLPATEEASSTGEAVVSAPVYLMKQVPIAFEGKQVLVNVPRDWPQTAKKETSGAKSRLHYDWKNADRTSTLTFIALDPPDKLRDVLHARDNVSLMRKLVIATFLLNDMDVKNLTVVPSAAQPNAFDLTCTTTVRSRSPKSTPKPHTLSRTFSHPLPLFQSAAEVRATKGSYVNRMSIVFKGDTAFIGCVSKQVDAASAATAAGTLESRVETGFLDSMKKSAE